MSTSPTSSTGSPFAVGDPSELGFESARLASIDAFIAQKYIDAGLYPGYILLIARGDQIAHLSCQGYDENAILRIFSMTKPITSVAVLQLFEQGRIALGDPVSDYLPAFAGTRVFEDGNPVNFSTRPPSREMNVQDLLTHTSGLTYGFMLNHPVDAMYRAKALDRLQGKNLEEVCDGLAELPLLFSPGERWSYSMATDVCGRIVEVVSGQSLDEYFAEHIFEPLGMVDTAFWADGDRQARLVPNHAEPSLSPFGVPEGATGKMAVIDPGGADSPFAARPDMLSGGGGLVSTVGDYHRFAQMLLNWGVAASGERVLGRRTIEYATMNHLPSGGDLASMGQPVFSETNYHGVGFGLGFSVMLDPTRAQVMSSVGEYGWGGAASTVFWVDPVEELVVIGLTQLMPSSAYPIRTELRAQVYGALS